MFYLLDAMDVLMCLLTALLNESAGQICLDSVFPLLHESLLTLLVNAAPLTKAINRKWLFRNIGPDSSKKVFQLNGKS